MYSESIMVDSILHFSFTWAQMYIYMYQLHSYLQITKNEDLNELIEILPY